MKCVAQMPQPPAAPALISQSARVRPRATSARRDRLMAVRLARKQTAPAKTTRRQSCSPPRHVSTRNMTPLLLYPAEKVWNDDRHAVKSGKPSSNVLKEWLDRRIAPAPKLPLAARLGYLRERRHAEMRKEILAP